MEIFKKEIDGKLHIRIEYTEEEKLKWKLRIKLKRKLIARPKDLAILVSG